MQKSRGVSSPDFYQSQVLHTNVYRGLSGVTSSSGQGGLLTIYDGSSWSVLFVKKVKVAQLCLTLCDPKDYTVHGILQARILQWVAFPFSRGSFQPRDRTQVSGIASEVCTS